MVPCKNVLRLSPQRVCYAGFFTTSASAGLYGYQWAYLTSFSTGYLVSSFSTASFRESLFGGLSELGAEAAALAVKISGGFLLENRSESNQNSGGTTSVLPGLSEVRYMIFQDGGTTH